ncbi:MAG: 7-carboxy-7-deazaguanine synthase QueE, partial [Gammaproteobacteria bacterium]|nr:7-carboxy-7-deazaguanine synthase QueE [Gammaproteobacteria bacterium]
EDFDWAKAVIEEYQLSQRTEVLMSPAFNELPAKRLAEWILEDQLQVRFQLQLHKILWGEEQGR